MADSIANTRTSIAKCVTLRRAGRGRRFFSPRLFDFDDDDDTDDDDDEEGRPRLRERR
jgi:hypothetical protein